MKHLWLVFFPYILLVITVCAHTLGERVRHGVSIEIKGKYHEVESLLPHLPGLWGSHLGSQAHTFSALPTERSP